MKKPDLSKWKRKLSEKAEAVARNIRERSSGAYGEKASAFLKTSSEKTKEILKQKGMGFYGKALTILTCTYFLSDLSGLLINSFIPDPKFVKTGSRRGSISSQKSQTIDEYEAIFSRNLFNSQGLIPGENTGTVDSTGPARRTTLPLKLVGTLVLQNEDFSIATIQDQSANKVFPVRKNDEIPSRIRVEKVEARRVTFLNLSNKRREYVELPKDITIQAPTITAAPTTPKSAGIEKLNSKRFSVSRNEIEKNLTNLNKILTQARAIPHFENGAPAGYKLFQIVPGSIYDQLGLKNGDIIKGVNGEAISNPQKAFEMLNDFKNLNAVELEIKRDGSVSNMIYDIQ